MSNIEKFLFHYNDEQLKDLMLNINLYQCRLKDTSTDRVCAGEITEEEYRKLRAIVAVLSHVEEDIRQLLGDDDEDEG